ncbi:hypothetical protein FRC03_000152 [Tulasnella sp. 419]|nr:hypothetical protein FRC03_000152 [Tulasnella sp. 419]
MLAFFNTFAAFILLLPAVLAGPLSPRRDTPNFYLTAVSSDANYHLKPLRVDGVDGSLGSGTMGKFYFDGGKLRADGINPPFPPMGYISLIYGGTSCGPNGPLNFLTGSSSNKCATSTGFSLASYNQNSQLGAQLVFNNAGTFYACSGGKVR